VPTPTRDPQVTNPDVIDQTAIDIAIATQQYAGYALYEKHATLQSGIVAIGAVVDLKICKVLSRVKLEEGPEEIIAIVGPLEEDPKAIIAIVDPLLSTTKSLAIRTVAYPSALICISTAQKLIMLLDMIKVPDDFEDTRVAWAKAVKELGKANTKWAKLQVPGSLVRLVRTQLELSIMSIPDPKVNII